MAATKVFLAASQSVTNALRSKVTDRLPLSLRTNRPFITEVLRRYPAFSALWPPASSRRACGVRQIAYPMMTGPSLVNRPFIVAGLRTRRTVFGTPQWLFDARTARGHHFGLCCRRHHGNAARSRAITPGGSHPKRTRRRRRPRVASKRKGHHDFPINVDERYEPMARA